MTREELLRDPSYWTAELQLELYRQIQDFMDKNNMNKTQLAQYLGCSKGYVSQLLSGEFDHKMSKFMELALAINKIPEFNFVDADEYIENDSTSYQDTATVKAGNYMGCFLGHPDDFCELEAA